MISSAKVPSLLPEPRSRSRHIASADRFRADSTTALSPPTPALGQHKVQAIKAKLAQKGKCPQYVFYIHFQTAYSVKRQQRLLLGTVSTGLCQRSRQPRQHVAPRAARVLSRRAHSHEDAWLWQWPWGDSPLIQLIRKVILCFQYETFHTVKSNPKTSWIQSSHTFKHDFIWYWI